MQDTEPESTPSAPCSVRTVQMGGFGGRPRGAGFNYTSVTGEVSDVAGGTGEMLQHSVLAREG